MSQGARPLRASDLVLLVPSEAADEIQEGSAEKLGREAERRPHRDLQCNTYNVHVHVIHIGFIRMWGKGG